MTDEALLAEVSAAIAQLRIARSRAWMARNLAGQHTPAGDAAIHAHEYAETALAHLDKVFAELEGRTK